ncbi:YkvA family protein [Agrobacterium sp. El2ro-1b]|uniref:YkvA family protein n=1 Tax=Agrobacterium sp. El2ro-1b TaxID=2969528 RepID=UPI003AAC52A2
MDPQAGCFRDFPILEKLKRWAKSIKRDVHALYLAARDPCTPFLAKVVALLVAAYALSPIDLIPDFIPVIGYVDDLVIVPLGILLAVRLLPPPLLAEHRLAAAAAQSRPVSRVAAAIFIVLWLSAALTILLMAKFFFFP